jgi:hypothetical protein
MRPGVAEDSGDTDSVHGNVTRLIDTETPVPVAVWPGVRALSAAVVGTDNPRAPAVDGPARAAARTSAVVPSALRTRAFSTAGP